MKTITSTPVDFDQWMEKQRPAPSKPRWTRYTPEKDWAYKTGGPDAEMEALDWWRQRVQAKYPDAEIRGYGNQWTAASKGVVVGQAVAGATGVKYWIQE